MTNPSQHEGALHSARLRIISNKALLLNADRAGLPPFIQTKPFVSKLWQPPNFEVLPPPQVQADPPREEDKSRKVLDDGAPLIVVENCDSMEPPRDEYGPLESMQVSAIAPGFNETAKPRGENESASSLVPPEGSAWDGSTLPATVPGYRSKRKRQQEEQNIHWLGDKVLDPLLRPPQISAAYRRVCLGRSRRCRSYRWGGLCHRWSRSRVEGVKGSLYCGSPCRSVV